MNDNPIRHPQVTAVFNTYPEKTRAKLLFLRQLIFETTAVTEGVAALEATLQWGEPSYYGRC